jgi:hypothetical protein
MRQLPSPADRRLQLAAWDAPVGRVGRNDDLPSQSLVMRWGFAIERMLAHRSGLIGFPLRLLVV